jgi:AIPR protein
MITERAVDQAYADLHGICRGVKEDYFGLLYLEREHDVPRDKALNQIAFGGNDYGIDGFHFDEARRNLYLFQFKYSNSYAQFKGSLQRLIEDGMERIFSAPNRDDAKNQVLLQLQSCLQNNRNLIDQICIRFVFTGDPGDAEQSQSLDALKEKLEDKKYLVDKFFGSREVPIVVEFRSSSGKVGPLSVPRHTSVFKVPLEDLVVLEGPDRQELHVGLMRLCDLQRMYATLGSRFFDRNIRYGLGESEAVNRAITKSLKQIILDGTEDPRIFAFNHNGITLFAEQLDREEGHCNITAPKLLNGAQTVTTITKFLEDNKLHPGLQDGMKRFEDIRILCRVLTNASSKFVTRVTINNNRQNPVEPWNLHANDEIQLELQDKFKTDLRVYYERQEKAFEQLSPEELEEQGLLENSKAVQLLRLTQTFLVTDGNISRLSEIRRVFEEDKLYEQTFRKQRLTADSRQILMCYKAQFRLKKLGKDITQQGQNKYAFLPKCRNLLWALLCQGLLNGDNPETLAEDFGTNLTLSTPYMEHLSYLATSKVRFLLGRLVEDPDYKARVADGNYSFLRSDTAFDRCMATAHEKWRWVHRKLAGANTQSSGKSRA